VPAIERQRKNGMRGFAPAADEIVCVTHKFQLRTEVHPTVPPLSRKPESFPP
jgi:hypothetical protein